MCGRETYMQKKIFVAVAIIIFLLNGQSVWAVAGTISVGATQNSFTTTVGENFSFGTDDPTKLWGLSPISSFSDNGQGPFPLGWQPQPIVVEQALPTPGIPIYPLVGVQATSFPTQTGGGIPAISPASQSLPGMQTPGPAFGIVSLFARFAPQLVVPGQIVGITGLNQSTQKGVLTGNGPRPFPLGLRDPISLVQYVPPPAPPIAIFTPRQNSPGINAVSPENNANGKDRILVGTSGNTVFADGSVAPGIEPIVVSMSGSQDGEKDDAIVRVNSGGDAVFVGGQGLPPLQLPTAVFGIVSPIRVGAPSLGLPGAGIPSLQSQNDGRAGIAASTPTLQTHDVVKIEFTPKPPLPPLLTPVEDAIGSIPVVVKNSDELQSGATENAPKLSYIQPGGPFPLGYDTRKDEPSASDLYPTIPPYTLGILPDQHDEAHDDQTAGPHGLVWTDHEKTYQAEIGEIREGVITSAPHVFFEDHVGKKLNEPPVDAVPQIRLQIDDTGHVQVKPEVIVPNEDQNAKK